MAFKAKVMSTLSNLTLAEMSAWSVKFSSFAPTLTVPFANRTISAATLSATVKSNTVTKPSKKTRKDTLTYTAAPQTAVLAQTGSWSWYGKKHPVKERENNNCYKRKHHAFMFNLCDFNAALSSETILYQIPSKK